MRLKKNIRFLLILIGVFFVGLAIGMGMTSPILSIFVASGGTAVIALLRDVIKDILSSGKKPFIEYGDVSVENRSHRQHSGEYKYIS